ncbi:histidinol-phosphate transaminase [Pseudoruegeria sp. SK021]|uniref:histidinol-phosphate transaminase n=1 Tax=Pseudoruegeria sp. SK021 TaxID=1933035 RepID=UPI000A245440|nr:histidinol-phosphate transaminase [Pseudoruegeria sp. SK021]OSP56485.1 histidinol-phosphate transaminase [Pseudoruegeria sp. SK021]
MSSALMPQPGIMEIALYEGGADKIPGVQQVIKLSSNENPYGPSPRAIEAATRSLAAMHRYPPTDHAELRQAIGDVLGLDPSRLICGAGSDEIIAFLCQAYAGPGDEVLYPEHGFLMYKISALAAGATPVAAPETARRTDVDALLAAATDRTRLVFVANPNNPTGTMVGMEELTRLAEGLPPAALLVLDGAYAEFVDGYDGGAALIDARDNVVMTRTFSKLYGLGGLRIGYGYGPKAVIDVLNRVRGPFNLSQTQQAAATAAIADTDYADYCRAETAKWRDWLAQALEAVGVPSDPSFGNFILARFADAAEAEACDRKLQENGLIVRRVAGYGLPHCLRISIGDEAACRRVAAVIAAFKAAAA